jgi:hypothetical protein
VLIPFSSFRGEINLNNVIRLALGRLGHAFDTHLVSSKELTQAFLLSEQVTHHSSFTDSKIVCITASDKPPKIRIR